MEFAIYNWGDDFNALEDWIDDWMRNHDFHYWMDVGELDYGIFANDVFTWTWSDRLAEQGEWVMEDLVKEYGRQGVEVERVN